MKKRFIHRKTINRAPSREICTCSMLTVTLLLLYRKLIPLRFLPWCDNLITLGCRRILVFLCFSKVKNRRLVNALIIKFRYNARADWLKQRALSEYRCTEQWCHAISPFVKFLDFSLGLLFFDPNVFYNLENENELLASMDIDHPMRIQGKKQYK